MSIAYIGSGTHPNRK